MITDAQIKKIHTLTSKYGIFDEHYRKILNTKFQVGSSRELDEEQASELIEYLIKITGDTYDKDNNTEYYQKKIQEKKELDNFCNELCNWIDKKHDLIKEAIIDFSEGYSKEELCRIFFEITTKEQNKEILHKLIK